MTRGAPLGFEIIGLVRIRSRCMPDIRFYMALPCSGSMFCARHVEFLPLRAQKCKGCWRVATEWATSPLACVQHIHLKWLAIQRQPLWFGSTWTFKVPKTVAFIPRYRVKGPSFWVFLRPSMGIHVPEGPSTQYWRLLLPKTIPLMDFGTRVLRWSKKDAYCPR